MSQIGTVHNFTAFLIKHIECKCLRYWPKTAISGVHFRMVHFFYKGQFIRAKMMSTENFGKNKGQSVLNFLDVRARRWGKK